ncbi:MAG: MarR family transcriptional regulator [Ornithinimicrobium sp.]
MTEVTRTHDRRTVNEPDTTDGTANPRDIGDDRGTARELDVPELAHDLRLACMRVSRRVRFEATQEIAPHQFSVLARLDDGSATLGELATRERVRAPSMSRTVGALVELGLIARSDDPQDGRVVRLTLSEHGHQVLEQERTGRDAWMAERLMHLNHQDKATLRAATTLLEHVINE